jgi:hypothetical protein
MVSSPEICHGVKHIKIPIRIPRTTKPHFSSEKQGSGVQLKASLGKGILWDHPDSKQ